MAIKKNYRHNTVNNQKTNGDIGKKERHLTLAKLASWCGFFGSVTAWYTLNCGSLQAQITSDGTVDTRIDAVNDVTEITGGARANSNLFHSFAEFSLATGQTAFFNNSLEIGNIISRVTGGNISNINGLIKANGNANLILINPSGINFGTNARLDLGGSFLGTTAESLIFADGTVFSATDTQAEPILTISVPLGLQLGQNSGAINISGEGHNLTVADPLFSPITFGEPSGLRVKAGETLALVGGEITVDGGTIAAPGGSIELGSIAAGTVNLDFNNSDLNLSYDNITAEGDIQLRSQALVDASGTTSIAGGTIRARGKQLSLNDGSLLSIQNLVQEAAGAIEINASESLTVSGTNNDATIRSSLTNETVGSGRGGDIKITTGKLTVDEGATIVAKTLAPGNGAGGNIEIDATESVGVIGASSLNPGVTSSIVAASFGTGDAGNNSLTTDFLSASAGGTIAATAFQTGNGGDLNINAREIEITGIEPNVFAPSALTASTLGAGNAGNLTIDTSKLTILAGGRVDASTAATGNAGNIAIAATESITIDGTVPNSVNPSLIIASGNILDPSLQQLLQLPATPSGNSGNVNITTSQLQITAGGQLTVRNDGTGNSGNLEVAADNISVNSGGGITAASQVGRGGNINLQVADNLSLTDRSQIINDNFGAATGGAIAIETDKLQISDRSFITTTTFAAGDGGNIDILANNIEITGTGFTEFQQNFQLAALSGTLQPGARGTGIFIGTAATGTAGNLTIDTQSLNLSEGAIIFSPVFTAGTGGDLNITATDINLNASALQIGAGVGSVESGSAGDINLETERLRVNDGGTVINLTFGNAAGGDIKITASDFIELRDSPLESIVLTGIYTNTSVGLGPGGDVNINTGNLTIEDAVIASNTGALLPDGNILSVGGLGGNVNIQADETIEVGGIPANLAFLSSGIGTTTYSASAAGDLTISTEKLIVRDGADFSTATLGASEGGTLTVNATDSIELIGTTTVGGMNRGGLLATSGRAEFPNLEVTGASGDIQINTSQLTVRDGAKIDVQSLGMGNAGNLDITADSILLANKGSFSAATQSGIGGNIEITTNTLQLNRGLINASVLQEGAGGNIDIQANESIEVIGSGFGNLQEQFFSPTFLSPEFLANLDVSFVTEGILAATTGEGTAGRINIQTPNLQLLEGGLIGTSTIGTGAAGPITIKASEFLKVDASIITASTIFSGQGGDIEINTGKLEVMTGGLILASTLGSGDGGNLTINASESIDVAGVSPTNSGSSNITAGAQPLTTATGNGGDLTITTPQLNIDDRGEVSVGSLGTGNAGNLRVNSDFITIDDGGTISAATQSGTGGNIILNGGNIVWRRESTTTATSAGEGNGGNITIDADNIVALENSLLTADADRGRGGNIQIDTQGLFVCGECQISASSQLGVDGVIAIQTIQPEAQLEAVDLPQQPTQPEETVALACSTERRNNNSELTITGRGGLPPRPQEPLSGESIVNFETTVTSAAETSVATNNSSKLPLPARSWYLDDQGQVVLTANSEETVPHSPTLPNSNCQVR